MRGRVEAINLAIDFVGTVCWH